MPLPTIKFYIREGLLPAGQRTSRNQASYDAQHLERLVLIRTLQDAGLRLEVIARALRAADNAKEHFVTAAIDALERPVAARPPDDSPEERAAEALLMKVVRKRGWLVTPQDVCVRDAVNALITIDKHFIQDEARPEELEVYVDAVEQIAKLEIADVAKPKSSSEAALRYAILGTVLMEPLILSLRRMAHVARTRKALGVGITSAGGGPAEPKTGAPAKRTKRR